MNYALLENAKICCGDVPTADPGGCCTTQCINPHDIRDGEARWCREWLIHDLIKELETADETIKNLKKENEYIRQHSVSYEVYLMVCKERDTYKTQVEEHNENL